MRLNGKTAIVTGGGRGIGSAIAKAFAREGAEVCVTARSAEQIERVADEIRAAGGTAAPIVCDVTDEDAVTKMVAEAEAALGPTDILVNNAGAALFTPIENTTLDEWNRLFAVNASGLFLCSKAVMPGMKERRRGQIIAVTSTAGRKGYPEQSAYCTAKHAAMGFCKVLALELQPFNVRVNTICPGGVDTELVRKGRDDVDLSRYMRPEEIADAAVFLASQQGIAQIDELCVRRVEATPWQ